MAKNKDTCLKSTDNQVYKVDHTSAQKTQPMIYTHSLTVNYLMIIRDEIAYTKEATPKVKIQIKSLNSSTKHNKQIKVRFHKSQDEKIFSNSKPQIFTDDNCPFN